MPCYVTGSAEGDARLSASEARDEATKATSMLCYLLTTLENEFGFETDRWKFFVDIPTTKFWREHKQIDAERLEKQVILTRKQKARRSAIQKLTIDERELLGIKE